MWNWVKGGVPIFLFSIVAVLLIPGIGRAEIYFGGMGGYSFPNDFSNVSTSGDFAGFPLPDIPQKNSVVGGGKVGFYLDEYSFLGFETEGFFTESETELSNEKLRVITWGINALFRYPGKRFQPYFGAGLGLFFAEVESDVPGPSLADDWVPGLNLLGGGRGFVTDSIAVFAEYKFNYVKLNLETERFNFQDSSTFTVGTKGTYSTNMIVGGLSFHFN